MSPTIASASIIAMKSTSEHGVAFYETEQHLCDIMSTYIGRSLRNGEPAMMIATAEHLEQCLSTMERDGIDVAAALQTRQLLTASADETLAKFMVDGIFNEDRFREVAGALIKKSLAGREDAVVRIFGEMVDVLWRRGEHHLALRLEDLWNDLGRQFSFNLLCAYYIGAFDSVDVAGEFDRICGQHNDVALPEGHSDLRDERSRMREIAMLQQRSIALEAEARRCRTAEAERDRLLVREKAAREEAENANHLKDEFLSVLSHELRTPLNAIIGWTQILAKQREERTVQRAVDTIYRNALLQKRLVEDLLDVSRIATGKLAIKRERVDMNQIVAAAVESVRVAAAAKEIDIRMTSGSSPVSVYGDADRLQQVVWNLLSNAVKFTPLGGIVTVRLVQSGPNAEISVTDTGEGVASDFLPHVFDRFRQADGSVTRRHGGLGVGLAIVRSLVEAHGGRVSATSEGPGSGATFVVTLPALAA